MSNSNLKLDKKILIQGEIEVLTGLMIGGTNSAMGIGGPDKTVIRNPFNDEPYIPGSSLKGKMRSLMELYHGYVKKLDRPMGKVVYGSDNSPNHITTVLFGATNKDTEKQRPSRLIFRDGKLLNGEVFRDKTDLPYTESKTEVVIDRITSAAMPRNFERVPAGAKFELNIVLNVFDGDPFKAQELIDNTYGGLTMLQDDYIGGAGSRGSGQVKITIKKVLERDAAFYQNNDGGEGKDITDSSNVPANLR